MQCTYIIYADPKIWSTILLATCSLHALDDLIFTKSPTLAVMVLLDTVMMALCGMMLESSNDNSDTVKRLSRQLELSINCLRDKGLLS